jgi:prolyl oligopeptidase
MGITPTTYPLSPRHDNVFDYYNVALTDPYAWLENNASAETKEWIKKQNEYSEAWLSQIPFRELIRQRLEACWDHERYSVPFTAGEYTYFYRNSGLQNQPVLYRKKNNDDAVIFIDPNTFSSDGATSLASIAFSSDGSLAACQLSDGGSDSRTVMVINTADGSIIDTTIKNVKFSFLSWKGNQGFYYSSYELPGDNTSVNNGCHHLLFHKLGTSQCEDRLVFGGSAFPRRFVLGYLTGDERYLVIGTAMSPTGNELFIKDLSSDNNPVINIVDNLEARNVILNNAGSTLYILTNLNASNFKLVTVDAADPRKENWKDLLPEARHALTATLAGGMIFANYMKDATSFVLQYNLKGELIREIDLPPLGAVTGFTGKEKDKEVYYTYTSYTCPSTIYKYNIETGRSEIFAQPTVNFNVEDYESKQVYYASKDGTRIPMIITHKKDLEMNGSNPTLLYAYGGFGISLTPDFNVSNVIFLEQGGIYAVPNIRGGGEYGKDWHEAGVKFKKHNVFDDYIAAAEYLISNNYTSKDHLAIAGHSNGGLLVGAIITKRPDLCKVALPSVGVMDMVRYHQFPGGSAWSGEYGTTDDSKEMFEYLLGYSPYHTLQPTRFPATLVYVTEDDDRVMPAHSYKFTARMQEYQQENNPVLIQIGSKGSHGTGKSVSSVISEQTDKWAFLFASMGLIPG